MTDRKPSVFIVGANGQVASEICLELDKRKEVILTALCRNPIGSVYLRANGLSVVHGNIEGTIMPEGIGTADVIINTIYVKDKPAAMRKRHFGILENIVKASNPDGVIIHFSTIAVFHKSSYAHEKLDQEEFLKKLAKKYQRKVIIFRLGHVFGKNQGHSLTFRDFLLDTPKISLPFDLSPDGNCVSIAYLTDIITLIAKKIDSYGRGVTF